MGENINTTPQSQGDDAPHTHAENQPHAGAPGPSADARRHDLSAGCNNTDFGAPEAAPRTSDAERPVKHLKPILEALLFALEEPVTAARLAEAVDGATLTEVRAALLELQTQYHEEGRGFVLEEIAGGFQLLSRPAYAPYLEKLRKRQSRAKLSSAALETLAIIAYRQPIGRAAIEAIRGVQAGPMLRMLIDKAMVRITGREEVIGRPFLYGTTKRFLEHFGLRSLKDLPQAEELRMP